MDPMRHGVHEAIGGTTTAGTAGACAECLVLWGTDPTVAAALAVVLGVVVRVLVVDLAPWLLGWWRRRRAARLEDAPTDPGE